MFKKLINKWNSISLILRILGGIVLAIILYLIINVACGANASWIKIIGNLFVGALKAIAPLLVFVLVISSLASAKGGIGRRFTLIIFLYIITTLIASFVAVGGSFLFPIKDLNLTIPPESGNPPENLLEVLQGLLNSIIENPISSLVSANYMGVLFWAIVLGIAFKTVGSPSIKNFFKETADAISKVVRGIISFAPFGVMSLVYTALSETGFSVFATYGKLIALIVGCMLVSSLGINPLISGLITRKNPYPLLWRCIKESALTAFFTRSSAANIPVNMNLCKNLGLDPDFYSVSIPLGATINMDGAAVTIAVMTLAAANTLGIHVDFGTAILLCIISTFAACGTSGIAGGSILLIPMACSLLGIPNDVAMQMVAIGFTIGVVQDSVESALNSSGDVLFTATAELYERRKLEKENKLKNS